MNAIDHTEAYQFAKQMLGELLSMDEIGLLGVIAEGYDEISSGLLRTFDSKSDEFKREVLNQFARITKSANSQEFNDALVRNPVLRTAIDYLLEVHQLMKSDAATAIAAAGGNVDSLASIGFSDKVSPRVSTRGIADKTEQYKRYVQDRLRRQAREYLLSPEGQEAIAATPAEEEVTPQDVEDASLPAVNAEQVESTIEWLASWLRSGAKPDRIVGIPGFPQHMEVLQAAFLSRFLAHAGTSVTTNDIQSDYHELGNQYSQSFSNLLRLVGEGERVSVQFMSAHSYAASKLGPYMSLVYIVNIMRKYNLNREQALIRFCYALEQVAGELATALLARQRGNSASSIRI
jgi:hypothetical protein